MGKGINEQQRLNLNNILNSNQAQNYELIKLQTKRKKQSIGSENSIKLGLLITNKLIKINDGKLEIESSCREAKRGTTVTFTYQLLQSMVHESDIQTVLIEKEPEPERLESYNNSVSQS